MDLYQLIKHDHQKVTRLFERLAEAAPGTHSHTRLFSELERELRLHTEVEEKHFYPALRRHDEAKGLIEEALDEHQSVKDVLGALARGDKEDPGWAEQLADLGQDVAQHVEEEETRIFPLAQRLLGAQEAGGIAHAIEDDKAAAQKASS